MARFSREFQQLSMELSQQLAKLINDWTATQSHVSDAVLRSAITATSVYFLGQIAQGVDEDKREDTYKGIDDSIRMIVKEIDNDKQDS